MRNKKKF